MTLKLSSGDGRPCEVLSLLGAYVHISTEVDFISVVFQQNTTGGLIARFELDDREAHNLGFALCEASIRRRKLPPVPTETPDPLQDQVPGRGGV